MAFKFPVEIIDNFKRIEGVIDAEFLFGPHDFYVLIQTEEKEKLVDTALRIRLTTGVASTITCNVIDKGTRERAIRW